MRRLMLVLTVVCGLPLVISSLGCSGKNPVAPRQQPEYRLVYSTPYVQIWADQSVTDSSSFSVSVVDSNTIRAAAPTNVQASWRDGSMTGYGWDADNDFYVKYWTPASCCYRVSMTNFLYVSLVNAGKPLIYYYSRNADGSYNWKLIIGCSAIKWMGPVSSWFLSWQAKMQYYL